jgi:hypothetical protein
MKIVTGLCVSLAFLFTSAFAQEDGSRDIEGQPGTPIVKECPQGHSYDARTGRCREEIRELGISASRHNTYRRSDTRDTSRSEGQFGTNTIMLKQCPPGHRYNSENGQCLEQ